MKLPHPNYGCRIIYSIIPNYVSSQKLRAKGLQRGKAASYKIALVILYIGIDWKKKPEARTYESVRVHFRYNSLSCQAHRDQ
jgi:hypothetical protein